MAHEQSDAVKLAELIKDVRVTMLTTFPTPGECRTRPMYTQKIDPEHFDGDLWFMTDTGTRKVTELNTDPRVLLTYAQPDKNIYIAVNGIAHPEHNTEKARELWTMHAKGFWPNGPEDPSLTLLRVSVDTAEYWDGPSNTSYMLKLLKAVVTHQRLDLRAGGEHAKMKI